MLCILLFGCSSNKTTYGGFSQGLTDDGYYEGIRALDYVTLPDFENMSTTLKEVDVEEMNKAIDDLKNDIGETIEVSRSAQLGDTVNISYVGSVDGVKFTGGSTNDEGAELVLGSGKYVDTFEDQIVGHSAGDSFKIVVTFPENYGDSTDESGNLITLSGKEAVFETTLNKVMVKELTEEAIAKSFGNVTLMDGSPIRTLEDLQKYYIEIHNDTLIDNYTYEYLITNSEVKEYPESLFEVEKNKLYNFILDYVGEGQTIDDVLKALNVSSFDEYVENSKAELNEEIKAHLILQALAEAQNFKIEDSDYIEILGSADELNRYIEHYGKGYMGQSILYDKALEFLKEKVTIVD